MILNKNIHIQCALISFENLHHSIHVLMINQFKGRLCMNML